MVAGTDVEEVVRTRSPVDVLLPPREVRPGVTVFAASWKVLPVGAVATMNTGKAAPAANEAEM